MNDCISNQLQDRLSGFIRRRVSNPADAEDLLQDVLLKVVTNTCPNEAGKMLPWVFAIARNRVIDYYRERGREPPHVDVDKNALPDGGTTDAPDSKAGLGKVLEAMIGGLSEQDQRVLRTVDLGGMSQKDYAAKLGIGYATAKSRVQRARKRLRRALEDCCRIELDRRGYPVGCEPWSGSDCH